MISDNSAPIIAGVDEVGRGCLAGPVVAGAVILYEEIPGVTDSKRLSPTKRNILAQEIKQRARCWSIGIAWPKEIDKYNIFQATTIAMIRAINALKYRPDFVFIDGKFSLPIDIKNKAVVKGDSLIPPISAASILAKTFRDKLMKIFSKKYPQYGFAKNKGYPTKDHIVALKRYGPSPIHRISFSPVAKTLSKEKRDCLL